MTTTVGIDKKPNGFVNGKTTTYVCKNFSCNELTNDLREFAKLLE